MSVLQKHLKSFGLDWKQGIQSLEDNFSIRATRHREYPQLYSFSYNQIESPFSEPLVREARGIILDRDAGWKVIARGYDKFFNLGEKWAAPIEIRLAKPLEKVDGTLILLYWYDSKWNVATTGTPDASGDVGTFGFSFQKLFWETFSKLGYSLPIDKGLTYLFELCTMYNRVVVDYKEPRLVLHGVRNPTTGQEFDPHIPYVDFFKDTLKWEVLKKIDPFYSENHLNDTLSKISGYEAEGFVLVDHLFQRVKAKCPEYIWLHGTISRMSPRSMLEVIRNGKDFEFLNKFPHFAAIYDDIKAKYEQLLLQCLKDWESCAPLAHQGRKEFSALARTKKNSGALFARLDGIMFSEYWKNIPIRSLERTLGFKDESK